MNSCAKLVVDKKRTRLRHELIDKLVVLMINRNFKDFFRKHVSIAKVETIENDMGNDETILELKF